MYNPLGLRLLLTHGVGGSKEKWRQSTPQARPDCLRIGVRHAACSCALLDRVDQLLTPQQH
jgi:hypothetical protein